MLHLCSIFDSCIVVRRGLAIGSTGTFPGGLAADLARCPVFFFNYYLFIYFLPSKCAKVIISDCGIPNKSII